MDISVLIGLLIFSLIAGLIGSLLGLGGGIIIIPALTLIFGYEMQVAIGASLVGVIATSTGAATHYVHEKMVNIRLGMVLETATTTGSIIGALIAVYTDQSLL
ncbi:MAG: TSUP family transporter, partial [Methanomassiliicoccales archaeon]